MPVTACRIAQTAEGNLPKPVFKANSMSIPAPTSLRSFGSKMAIQCDAVKEARQAAGDATSQQQAAGDEQQDNLADMFHRGDHEIERKRTDNLFKQLDERQLTEEEQAIINKRVELQRKLFQEFEKRERSRKVHELLDVCPDLTLETATTALELCNWKEEEAAVRFVSDPLFRRRVLASLAEAAPQEPPAALLPFLKPPPPGATNTNPQPAGATRQTRATPSIQRPRLVDAAALQKGHVFCGAFRGRLGPTQMAQQLQRLVDKGVLNTKGRPTAAVSNTGKEQGRATRSSAGRNVSEKGRKPSPEPDTQTPAHETELSPTLEPQPTLSNVQPPGIEAATAVDSLGCLPLDSVQLPGQAISMNGCQPQLPDELKWVAQAVAMQGVSMPNMASQDSNTFPFPELQTSMAMDATMSDMNWDMELAGLLATNNPNQPQDFAGCQGLQVEDAEFEWGPTGIVYSSQEGQETVRVCMQDAQLAALVERAVQEAQNLDDMEENGDNMLVDNDSLPAALPAMPQQPDKILPPPSAHPQLESSSAGAPILLHPPISNCQQPDLFTDPSLMVVGDTQANSMLLSTLSQQGSQQQFQHVPVGKRSQRTRRGSKPGAAVKANSSDSLITPQQLPCGPTENDKQDTHWQALASHILKAPARLRGARMTSIPPEQLPDVIDAMRSQDAQAVDHLLKEMQYTCDVQQPASTGRETTPTDSTLTTQPTASLEHQGLDVCGSLQLQQSSQRDGVTLSRLRNVQNAQNMVDTGGEDRLTAADSRTVTASQGQADDTISDAGNKASRGTENSDSNSSDSDGQTSRHQKRRKVVSKAQSNDSSCRAKRAPRASAKRAQAAMAAAAAVESLPVDEQLAHMATASASVAKEPTRQRRAKVREASPAAGSDTAGSGGVPPMNGTGTAAAVNGMYVTLGHMLMATRKGSGTTRSSVAISARGHTNRGRVKQKGAKRAELLEVGRLRVENGWFNAGYIFPDGFKSRTIFRSSIELAAVCVHECSIVGEGGTFWPLPTFQVTAMDRPNEPLVAKSCTGCWSQVLKRINHEIETRRAAGEDLPPAPKTAIAGPEYFGFNQPEVVEAVEALDPQHQCTEYWVGKEDRFAMMEGVLPMTGAPAAAVTHTTAPAAASGRGRPAGTSGRGGGANGNALGRGRRNSAAELEAEDVEDIYAGNRWTAIDRAQRYRKRCAESGDAAPTDEDHPLPGFLDPITLEVVVNPAISPYGHVMGMATWRAVLSEHKRCPFTKQPLSAEQLVSLNKNNIERYRDRIVSQ